MPDIVSICLFFIGFCLGLIVERVIHEMLSD